MSTVAVFAVGVFIGLIIYWVVYRMFWNRWRKYQEQDMSYLRSKIESAQFTSLGLERQITAQKADLVEQHNKITALERESWQAQARLAEMSAEKQALVMHLETMRVELAAYKKAASDTDQPSPSQPQNGKTHNSPAISSGSAPLPKQMGNTRHESRENGTRKDASGADHAPVKPPNGKTHEHVPPEQIMEPVLVIERPRMGGDRLEIIQGIGPAIIKKLNRAGIDTFQALSQLSPERLKELVGARAAKLIDAESVISQAKKLNRERRSRNIPA